MQTAFHWCRNALEARWLPATRPSRSLKRQADVVLASALLVLASPLILLSALLIRLTSPGPVVFRQTRVGLDGQEFELLKLRTMLDDAERQTGAVWAAENDPRMTRVGRYLRKYRVDELPQLVNVLRGSMSLVGPRPERPVFVSRLRQSIPHFQLRTRVLPGITGLAQVELGYGASTAEAEEKLKHDLEYVRGASVWLDLEILLRTVSVVMRGAGR